MKNKFLIKVFTWIGAITIACLLILDIPIFSVSTQSIDKYKQNIHFDKINNVCILKYTYTTGVGWLVEDTDIEQLMGQNVCLSSLFDPRLLRDNNDFELDYSAKLIVSIDTVNEAVVDSEKVYVIKPKNIAILYDTAK